MANFARSWTFYLLLQNQLTYMREVLNMAINDVSVVKLEIDLRNISSNIQRSVQRQIQTFSLKKKNFQVLLVLIS